MKQPELLSPAGTLKHLRYAFAYGADAVYVGQPRYSLRVRQNNFDKLTHLAQAIEETHALGKKIYIACNILPHNAKLKTFLADITPVIDRQPDALIMADPGLINLARTRWPQMPIHLSVQANTMNSAAVQFWQQMGLHRIILSRELSLAEIAEIRAACPDVELEVFIHGALCIAYSGRCLLSGYFNHRDANQGSCTNACRWAYKTYQKPTIYLEESKRPGEYLPLFEDEQGTYIMNSKDLRAVQHVEQLMAMGIDALKIEGRTKSYYYVARTAHVYRQAIAAAAAGQSFDTRLSVALEGLANRGYTEGFYRRHVPEAYQNYHRGDSESLRQRFVGEVLHQHANTGLWAIEVKNHFALGDQLELLCPQGSTTFTLTHLESETGKALTVAPGSGYRVCIPLPTESPIAYGLLIKNLV